MKGCGGLFVFFLVGWLPLLGCSVSVQSTQVSFLKGMLEKKDRPPEKNWRVIWDNKEYLGFAVNFDGGTYFANEDGLLVSFDGWQVVGLNLPGLGTNKVSDISYQSQPDGGRVLTYSDRRGKTLSEDLCESWIKKTEIGAPSPKREPEWLQMCQSGDGFYHNEIELNDSGQLVRLVFTVKPKAGQLRMEYIQ